MTTTEAIKMYQSGDKTKASKVLEEKANELLEKIAREEKRPEYEKIQLNLKYAVMGKHFCGFPDEDREIESIWRISDTFVFFNVIEWKRYSAPDESSFDRIMFDIPIENLDLTQEQVHKKCVEYVNEKLQIAMSVAQQEINECQKLLKKYQQEFDILKTMKLEFSAELDKFISDKEME